MNKKGLVGLVILIILLVVLAAITYFLFSVVSKDCVIQCLEWDKIIKP